MSLESLLIRRPVRPRIFVSYHHANDRQAYEDFVQLVSGTYDVCTDHSVRGRIHSDNSAYVIRRIREEYISGSSVTVVLCGRDTPWRKFVDWEIKATLDAQHGLVGLCLPSCALDAQNLRPVPDRLFDNIQSGYAEWIHWPTLLAGGLTIANAVHSARERDRRLIVNSRELMSRNGTSPYVPPVLPRRAGY